LRLVGRVPRKRAAPPRRSASSTRARARARGEAGKARGRAELRRILSALSGDDFYPHDGAVSRNHSLGTAFPTAEIGHLAVTAFGVFVIETKNSSGLFEPVSTRDELACVGMNGERETRRSPLAQNSAKVVRLTGCGLLKGWVHLP
jgi:hypothetical protein